MSLRAIRLAAKFNLILLIDQAPQNTKRKPVYLVDDSTPRAQIGRLLKGHWVVHRAITQPRLVPRGCI